MTTIIYKNALVFEENAIPPLIISKISGEGVGRVCIKIDGECDGYISLCGKKTRLCFGEAVFELGKSDDGVYEPYLVTASKVFKCAKFQKSGDRILYSTPSDEELSALELSLVNAAKRFRRQRRVLLRSRKKFQSPKYSE